LAFSLNDLAFLLASSKEGFERQEPFSENKFLSRVWRNLPFKTKSWNNKYLSSALAHLWAGFTLT